ncbi:MAG: DNA-binding protein [Alphaproteobacteria bacterium]|nr:MAG: DNA-binding protein [Alphaproteobacteria bacterium]
MIKSTSAPPSDAAAHFLKEETFAVRLSVSRRTLQRWRATGEGPAFMKFGRNIRYPLEAVLAFEASARHGE